MTSQFRRRVLMIALDAGELSFIRASLAALPTFRRLLDESVYYPLRSTAEHIAASVWPTMYTGSLPGEHGISQHIQWDPASMRLRRISSDVLYCDPFWSDFARAGLGVTVVDVPFTFPGRLNQVTEVLNWGSHDLTGRFQANPPALGREVRRRFGHHPMGYEIPVFKDTRQLAAMTRECVEGAGTKGRLVRWLRDTTEWDFLLAVFGECHRAGHILWRANDHLHGHVPPGALLDVYRAVDAAIGRVLEGVDTQTTTVVVFALHGMGANFSQEHFMRPVVDRINATFLGDGRASNGQPASQRGLIRILRESMPASLQHAAARAVPVEVRDWIVGREVIGGLDWSRTPGFALRPDLHSFLRLNLAGREARGMLEPDRDDYHRYIDHVTKSFIGLREAATERPLVCDVIPAQEVFAGRRRELLPDFIIRWQDGYPVTEAQSPGLGSFRGVPDRGRTGEHRFNGFALVLGPGARNGGLPPLDHNSHFPAFVSHLLGVRRES